MASGYFIRHTLIDYSHLETLPEDRRNKIAELSNQFSKIGYIDATTQIGPDQWARTSQKQRDSISSKAIQAFRIEDEIKQLLRSNEQIEQDNQSEIKRQRQSRIDYINNRLRVITDFCQRKLQSNRENPTKKEYRTLKAELSELINPSL